MGGEEVKFNIPKPVPTQEKTELRVGNVYPCKGGGKTRYWIVIGMQGSSVNLLGINGDGVVTSTANYGAHVFQESTWSNGRELLGHCPGIAELEFDITWFRSLDETPRPT
ncbi:MAG TPA: hypothetical protein PK530_18770 [Anaerolineales bacterium]|nr:hypothetical protein [Anaerolineales bacterium]